MNEDILDAIETNHNTQILELRSKFIWKYYLYSVMSFLIFSIISIVVAMVIITILGLVPEGYFEELGLFLLLFLGLALHFFQFLLYYRTSFQAKKGLRDIDSWVQQIHKHQIFYTFLCLTLIISTLIPIVFRSTIIATFDIDSRKIILLVLFTIFSLSIYTQLITTLSLFTKIKNTIKL